MSKIIYDTQWFIKKARKVHGNRYDYSKVDYKGSHTKVIIVCPEHGEFLQTPGNHLNGQRCPKCYMIRRSLSTKEFIKKAQKIHGQKYDYSKVVYKKRCAKVTIICPVHGEFEQTPGHHLISKCGCTKCSQYLTKRLTTEEFIKRSKKIHKSKYDYSKVVYKNNATKVTIICPIHGEFKQSPANHLKGLGCKKCYISSRTSTVKRFIKGARKIHRSKYDYSKVVYKNSYSKIIIICPIHGEFKQRPHAHLQGTGCPICARECHRPGFNRSGDPHSGYLYFITCKTTNESFCKIGTAYDTVKRFNQFPFEIIDSLIIPGIIGHLSVIEEKIKKDFKKYQYIPRVKFAGRKECFYKRKYKAILKFINALEQ